MSVKFIVNGFTAVVAVLVALGVWGWYASDDSRAEVERIRETRRMRIFCEEYRGVDDLERIYGPGLPDPSVTYLPPEVTTPDPTDPGSTLPGPTDPGSTLPGSAEPGPVDPGGTDPGFIGPGGIDPGLIPPSSYVYEPVELVDLERLESNAPAAMEDEIAAVADASQEMRETGNIQVFADPEVQRAVQGINDFGTRYCR